jgi:aspartate/methionine/tyrosine aminotransferase
MVSEFKLRRDMVFDALSSIHDLVVTRPEGAFYMFFDVSRYYGLCFNGERVKDSTTMATYLLHHHHVATIPGAPFGNDACLRLSYACSMSELDIGVKRIRQGLEALG